MHPILVGGFPLLRHGLAKLLDAGGLPVAAEAADAREALRLARAHSSGVVYVVDGDFRPCAGVVRHLAREDTSARILVLSNSASDDDVAAAVAAGASGYLVKTTPPETLVGGIVTIARGEALFLPRGAAGLLARADARLKQGSESGLSEREVEVLTLLAAGRENSEIAARLFISPSTAKTHVSHILRKLGAQNRIQAAVYAVRAGLI